jgi:hypothetical protein
MGAAPGEQGRSEIALELTCHAFDKLETYGIEAERLNSWREAQQKGEAFWDVTTGMPGNVFWWEGRPWVVIYSQDGSRIVTTYPTDPRTVTSRRRGGRWISPKI